MKKGSKRGSRGRKSRKGSLPAPTAEYSANTSENRAALAIAKAFKGPNNKYINTLLGANGSSGVTLTVPYVQLLNGVAQGTSENTRVGRLTKNLWLDLDIDSYAFSSTAANNDFFAIRFYVVAETTALGSAVAPSQFFVDASSFSPFSQRDRTNRNASRYVVLWDSKPQTIGTPGVSTGGTTTWTAATGSVPVSRYHSIHLPLNFQTDYSRGNAGSVSDIDTNSLYLIAVTDCTLSSTVNVFPTWTLCFRDDS